MLVMYASVETHNVQAQAVFKSTLFIFSSISGSVISSFLKVILCFMCSKEEDEKKTNFFYV